MEYFNNCFTNWGYDSIEDTEPTETTLYPIYPSELSYQNIYENYRNKYALHEFYRAVHENRIRPPPRIKAANVLIKSFRKQQQRIIKQAFKHGKIETNYFGIINLHRVPFSKNIQKLIFLIEYYSFNQGVKLNMDLVHLIKILPNNYNTFNVHVLYSKSCSFRYACTISPLSSENIQKDVLIISKLFPHLTN